VGLVGWWRRVELENDKLDNKKRKLEENNRKKEENKLEFLRKFYPNISTTPRGSEKLRSGKKNLIDLNTLLKVTRLKNFLFHHTLNAK
jgi:hypothetical protein